MLRTKEAKKLLTKAEQQHLTESGINSMMKMKSQVDFMKTQRKKSNPICNDCFNIAHKLGLME